MAKTATLLSTGIYLPDHEVPNEALRQRLAQHRPEAAPAIAKLAEATGITTRWYAPDSWATSDLAVSAAQAALDAAGLTADDLDLILVGTDTPDTITPATSVIVQHKLGAHNAGTFDVGCACASFPTAVANAAGLLQTNPWMKHVLVVGAYLMQRLADPLDPTIFFYGDGAGAAILGVSEEPGFLSAAFSADGSLHDRWGIYSGGTAEPASVASIEAGRTQVRMLKAYPKEVNHEGWPRLVRQLAQRGDFAVSDIDLAIFTQVRLPSIEHVMAALELPLQRAHWVMDRWGYTGSACIPMALHDALQRGKAGPGDLVVLVGSGVGANQAGVALRLGSAAIQQ